MQLVTVGHSLAEGLEFILLEDSGRSNGKRGITTAEIDDDELDESDIGGEGEGEEAGGTMAGMKPAANARKVNHSEKKRTGNQGKFPAGNADALNPSSTKQRR